MECFQWGSMGHLSRNMEDSGAEADKLLRPGSRGSEEKNVSKWPGDYAWDGLVKNVAACYHCRKNMSAAK